MEAECSACKKKFSNVFNLRKHARQFHPYSLDKVAPSSKYKLSTNYLYTCSHCGKNFNIKKQYDYHVKRFHLEFRTQQKKNSKCPICDFVNTDKNTLVAHFSVEHNINILTCKEEILKIGFEQWKSELEKETNSKFIKVGHWSSDTCTTTKYVCHRSGHYVGEGKNMRHLKTQGSCKINGYCPASLKVLDEKESLYFKIEFCKTHVGHKCDLEHLTLSLDERKSLSQKIAAKISFDDIVEQVRDSVVDNNLQRLHLLTKKDLHNISQRYNLGSVAVRHPNDAVSVDSWVNEMSKPGCSNDLLERKKKELISNFSKTLEKITTIEQIEMVSRIVAPISPTLAAMSQNTSQQFLNPQSSFPHKKKVDAQRRLFSTKKKTVIKSKLGPNLKTSDNNT